MIVSRPDVGYSHVSHLHQMVRRAVSLRRHLEEHMTQSHTTPPDNRWTWIRDFLAFKHMVAPALLQVLFWAGIAGTLYGTWVLIQLGNWAWWLALIFGTLGTRVLFEIAILGFRIFDRLTEIRDLLSVEMEPER
jgi:hypothetical protein